VKANPETKSMLRFFGATLLAASGTAFTASAFTATTGRDWLTAFAAGLLFAIGVTLWDRRARPRESGARLSLPQPTGSTSDRVVAAIADSNPDAVIFFSDSGSIRYANPTARELFFDGKSPEGQNFLRLMAAAPLPLREALLGESDRLFNIELEGQRETFHVSRRNFFLEGDLHTLLIVKHLTREISRREVDVLKNVIRVISHEVNNSLAPVSSLVHSARKISQGPEPGGKLGRVFDTIEERTRHLATFLEGYASLARLPEPRPRRVEWEPFLRQIAELHPGVKLPEPPSEPGYFDPVQIEQLVINLIKNAVEAGSPSESVEIIVKIDAAGETDLRVRDHGPGFSEEALKSALIPLYSTKERGSGMGLALCREIAEAHGGSIGLANASDGGSWVGVRLPGRKRDDHRSAARSRLTLTRG
jgi:two-component system nitrogen regulation sensor histidine kinase NtrY